MVWNYTTKYYVPGMQRSAKYCADDGAELFKLTRWQNRLKRHWKNVAVTVNSGSGLSEDDRILSGGESRDVSLKVHVDGLKPQELRVELILERQDAIHGHQQMEIYPMSISDKVDEGMFEYKVRVKASTNGTYRYNCRVMPSHPDFFSQHETRLIKWLD